GALARSLDEIRLHPKFRDARGRAKKLAEKLPGGGLLEALYGKVTHAVHDLVAPNSWFTHFGLIPLGPVDGHD
ncbi:1-deoxy-D-xylulose-5-phosphate synthase N-terminal domain-containing protein, partial [Salmonella enterica]|uniref:1-deoxy-D-xylulose-5-phosphate synthase N-terminal domain-containing protein n=1 Tax=Salmonella enterica TaxID=28901 RepID=UPI003296C492